VTANEWGESHLKHDLGLDLVVMSLGDEVKHGSLTTTLCQWPVKIGAKVVCHGRAAPQLGHFMRHPIG